VVLELSMGLIVVGTHRGLLDGAIHSLDLPIGPRVVGFGEPVVDVVTCTSHLKGVRPEDFTLGDSPSDL